MKKFLQIILGISFLFLLVGCSSQETATFTQKLDRAEFFVTYTYDKNKDVVTKIKTEVNQSAEFTEARKENEKLFEELKGIDGVVTSITEKDGKLIVSLEIDLKKMKWSTIKNSDNLLLLHLAQSSYLIGEDDDASFSRSKKAAEILGFTEQKK